MAPTPKRKAGSPLSPMHEEIKRDAALAQLEKARIGLCDLGREVAIEIAQQKGRVTSVDVFAVLRSRGYDDALDAVDPRWMGVVFREDCWHRLGFETTGSHKRPVAIWNLVDPSSVPLSPREVIIRQLSACRDNGATTEELSLATDMKMGRVRTQVEILSKIERVWLTAMKRRGLSGRKSPVYVLTEYLPDVV